MTGGWMWLGVVFPLLAGAAMGFTAPWSSRLAAMQRRVWCAFAATIAMSVPAVSVVASSGEAALRWGAGLTLTLSLQPMVVVAALLVSGVALPVAWWACAHEELDGIERLVGGLVAFVGAMELVVLASDLLTLIIGWELVGTLSWLLIAQRWRDAEKAEAASYAYDVTRCGGLGLLLAAGASVASTGSFAYDDLSRLTEGLPQTLFAAGILLAAAAKSAQLPFSPWLFRAMRGPSSVSALLHSSTMVAAGAWLLIRLHEPLGAVPWFSTAAITIGLCTAWAGGVVACLQPHAKQLLAASTSAQFGLVFVAVGSGFAGAGLAHLVTHAAFKALLFLVAGTAIAVAGSARLQDMGLARVLPWTAAVSLVGAWALSGLPPMGAAWSKEQVVAAAFETMPVVGWSAVGAAALSTVYALRFHILAYGWRKHESAGTRPAWLEVAAPAVLAAATIGLGVLWLPTVHQSVDRWLPSSLPSGTTAELVASLAVAATAAVAVAIVAWRRGAEALQPSGPVAAGLADWLGVPGLIERLVIVPAMAVAHACAELERRLVEVSRRATEAFADRMSRLWGASFHHAYARGIEALRRRVLRFAALGRASDEVVFARAARGIASASRRVARRLADQVERVLDAVVRGLGRTIDFASDRTRATQTGAVPIYYTFIVVGLAAFVGFLALGR